MTGAKRRTVKDCDAEIVALKRELIEARSTALSLSGQVARLEERVDRQTAELKAAAGGAAATAEIEAVWALFTAEERRDSSSLAQAVEEDRRSVRESTIEEMETAQKEDQEEREREIEKESALAEDERDGMIEALEAAGIDWDRVWWKYGPLCANPVIPGKG